MTTRTHSVPLAEAKRKLSELVDRVNRGEEFIITRHDTEIARLVPARRRIRADLSKAIAKLRSGRDLRPASTADIMAWRSEGGR